jgi:hypothetical protein
MLGDDRSAVAGTDETADTPVDTTPPSVPDGPFASRPAAALTGTTARTPAPPTPAVPVA